MTSNALKFTILGFVFLVIGAIGAASWLTLNHLYDDHQIVDRIRAEYQQRLLQAQQPPPPK